MYVGRMNSVAKNKNVYFLCRRKGSFGGHTNYCHTFHIAVNLL